MTKTHSSNERLWIKVVESRHLFIKSFFSRPYCVVEFEKNEFVTKEATLVSISHLISQSCTVSTYQSSFNGSNNYGFQTFAAAVDHPLEYGLNPVWKHEAALYFILF